jgi:hypothetical protein
LLGDKFVNRGIERKFSAAFVATCLSASVVMAAPLRHATPGCAQMVITAIPAKGLAPPAALDRDDLTVTIAKGAARVAAVQSLGGALTNLQLFILLDDSLPASTLGIQIPQLKAFIEALPPGTQVAVGYMRNGTFGQVQGFTADHQNAAQAVRLPIAEVGGNGSPYFALSDLARHWPSKELTGRRAVLMLTDGVDRYYGVNWEVDDPYVDAAVQDALKNGIMVYSIYMRDAGLYDRGGRTTLFAQSRLQQVSEETGGYAYFQEFTNPVSVSPFLSNLQNRLDHQYRVTIEASNVKGVQPVKVRSEIRGLKIEGPTRVFVP